MSKRLLVICTLGAVVGLLIVTLNPVNDFYNKLAILGCLGGAWLGFLLLLWRRKPVRITILTLPILAIVPFLLPGREIEADELRDDYVRRLIGFEGTKYYWGGESSRGIDCSGLPRKALQDSLWSYGIRNFNGRAFRKAAEHWWYDASAKALSEGYRDYTEPLSVEGTVQKMDYSELVSGDLAVTTGRLHLVAYLGDGKWIQADPGSDSVVILDGRTSENGWFKTPMTTHRWSLLAKSK